MAIKLLIFQIGGLQCVSPRAEKPESLTSSKMDFIQFMNRILGDTAVYNSMIQLEEPGEPFQTYPLMNFC